MIVHPGWSRRRRVVVALLGVAGALWLGSAASVFWLASHDRAAAADAIVVLGAAQYRGKPSPVLRARLDHAVALFAQGFAPRVVLTGGIAEGDTESEASVARTYVLRAGVPDSAILLENDGRTTQQSLQAVAQLLEARGLSRVILVSDPFHLFRASVVARRNGLTVRTSPTRADDAWGRLVRQPGYFLAESLKAPAALVFEW
ncbi:MAG: YdcF family protein [Gemmatimonadetes bacterium]|nr:YdcF family protein [Gemmatimonadota bacterium]